MRLLVLKAIARLTLARQSETVRPDNRLWVVGMKRIVTAAAMATLTGFLLPDGGAHAQTATVRRAHRAGAETGRHRCVRTAPAAAPPRADLPAGAVGARCLSALQSGTECGAQLHRDLCAGIPAERHGDHAAHELLLAARLAPRAGADQTRAIASSPTCQKRLTARAVGREWPSLRPTSKRSCAMMSCTLPSETRLKTMRRSSAPVRVRRES